MSDIFEELSEISLARLCRDCRVDADTVIEFVDAGLLTPHGRTQTEWRFNRLSIMRMNRARRLCQDLGLNTAGAALALELIDELETLRRKVAVLEDRQPGPSSSSR